MSNAQCPMTLAGQRARLARTLFIAILAGAAAVRLYFTTCMMVTTGDIIRNLYYGILIDRAGLFAAAHPLADYHGLGWVCWSEYPYIYPIVSLFFFGGISAVWPAIFFGKLMLTLIEAANTVLVWRLTRNRWLAVLYWASPVSVWWVSREGQFEPLQNLFVLGALCLLGGRYSRHSRRRPEMPKKPDMMPHSAFRIPHFRGSLAPLAFLLLALGIQVKLTAVLLVPLFIVWVWRADRTRLFRCLLAFLAGFAPTLLALRAYPILNLVTGNLANMPFNPYYWNPSIVKLRDWLPAWQIVCNQVATWGALALLGWRLLRGPGRWDVLAPLAFVLAVKLHTNVQPWYFVLWPAFILPVTDRRLRWALFALYPLLDVSSTLALFGYLPGRPVPDFYPLIGVFRSLH